MSLRRQLGMSMLVQGVGAASVLLATLGLGASLGPEQQGVFSRTKAEIEFIAALVMFGLPQALFYFVKSGRLGSGVALCWAGGGALLSVPFAAIYALVRHPYEGMLLVATLTAAVGLCVFHGQLRALLLVGKRTEWFNVVTAMPQVLLLLGVLTLIGLGAATGQTWSWLFALAFGSAAVLALWCLKDLLYEPSSGSSVGWLELGRYGLAAWLTAALATAAILFMQGWVETSLGAASLGIFTLAMTLAQVPLTPISYAAPLLFRRWIEQPGTRASQRWAVLLFVALLAVAALMWLTAPLWPHGGLGDPYVGLSRALALLLVGSAAEAASRVLGVNASARGTPWIAVFAEAARWLVLGVGWFVPVPQGLLPICVLWSAAALAAAAVFVLYTRFGVMRSAA